MRTLLKNNEAVHCKTEKEFEQVCHLLEDDGYLMASKRKPTEVDFCSYFEYTKGVLYTPSKEILGKCTTIIPVEEFLLRVKLPRKWKVLRTKDNYQIVNNYIWSQCKNRDVDPPNS